MGLGFGKEYSYVRENRIRDESVKNKNMLFVEFLWFSVLLYCQYLINRKKIGKTL